MKDRRVVEHGLAWDDLLREAALMRQIDIRMLKSHGWLGIFEEASQEVLSAPSGEPTRVETRKTSQITRLLVAAGQGQRAAHERLWAAIYQELHAIAQQQLAAEPPGHTLQPTSLVHEAYLRLIDAEGNDVCWENRRHFFGAAAQAMRRIRIDDARKRNRLKRGGIGVGSSRGDSAVQDCLRVGAFADFERPRGLKPAAHPKSAALRSVVDAAGNGHAVFDQDPTQVLAIDEALTRLEQEEPRQAEVVVLRYFAGLSIDESAEALEVAPRTVDNDWRYAKAWLHRELSKGDTTVHWLPNGEPGDRRRDGSDDLSAEG